MISTLRTLQIPSQGVPNFKMTNQKEPRVSRGSFCQTSLVGAHGDVGRLGSFRTLLDIELDLLAFLQVAETFTLNGGEMDEYLLPHIQTSKS